MGGDSALHAAASANGQQVYEVKCGGKSMSVTIGSIGVQLLVAQKRGAPSSTTLQYERMLDVSALESEDDYVYKATAVQITMKDGEKTTMVTPVAQEICLEVLIKLDQIDLAKKKEMTSGSLRALSELSSDESSSEEESSEEESSSDDDDRFKPVDSEGSDDSDDGDDDDDDDDDDDGDGGTGTGLKATPRLQSALKKNSSASKKSKGLPGRKLAFEKTVSYDDGSFDGPQHQEPEPEPEPQPEQVAKQKPGTADAETVAALRASLAAEQKKVRRAESARQEMFKELQKREDSVAMQKELAQENERLQQQLEAAKKAAATAREEGATKAERRPGWEERMASLRERLSIPATVEDDDVLDTAVDELERRLASALEAKQSAESAAKSANAAAAEKVAEAERVAAEAKSAAAKKVADAEKMAAAEKAAAAKKVASGKRDAAAEKKMRPSQSRPAEAVPPATAAAEATGMSAQPRTLDELQALIAQAKQVGTDGRLPQHCHTPSSSAIQSLDWCSHHEIHWCVAGLWTQQTLKKRWLHMTMLFVQP